MGLSKLNRGLSTGLWGLGANAQGGAVSPPPPPAPAYPAPWAYYPLSANANDASGNGRNLTGTQGSYSGSGGVVSGYTDGVISLTNAASASPTTWTMCAWVKPIGGFLEDLAYTSLYWDSQYIEVSCFFGSSTIGIPGDTVFVDTVWNHAAVVNASSTPQSYVNDISIIPGSPVTYNGDAFSITNSIASGSSNSICEVAIWKNTALTALEISAVYDKGVAGQSLV